MLDNFFIVLMVDWVVLFENDCFVVFVDEVFVGNFSLV